MGVLRAPWMLLVGAWRMVRRVRFSLRSLAIVAAIAGLLGLAGVTGVGADPIVDPNCSVTRQNAGECVRQASGSLSDPAVCSQLDPLVAASNILCRPTFSFDPTKQGPTSAAGAIDQATAAPPCNFTANAELAAATGVSCYTNLTDLVSAQQAYQAQVNADRTQAGIDAGITPQYGPVGSPGATDTTPDDTDPPATSESDAETQARDQATADQAAAAACPQARLGEPCDVGPTQGQANTPTNLFGRGDGYPVGNVVLYYGIPEWQSPGWNPAGWGDWLSGVVINATDMFNGWVANGIFSGYKYAVYGSIQLTGVVVFGGIVFAWLLEPAAQLNEHFNLSVVGPIGLVGWIVALVGALALMSFARGRTTKAFSRVMFAILVLGLVMVAVPRDLFVSAFNIAGSIAGVVMAVLSGSDLSGVPEPDINGAVLEQSQNLQYFHILSLQWEKLTISNPAQLITFGEPLQGKCLEIWEAGVAKGYAVTDKAALDALGAEPDCARFAKEAAVAGADRAIFALLFLLIALLMAFSFLFIMAINAEAQMKSVWHVATFAIRARFAAISTGSAAGLAREWLKAMGTMVVTAVVLGMTFVMGKWWADATAAVGTPMLIQIAPVCVLPLLLILGLWIGRKKFNNSVDSFGQEEGSRYNGPSSTNRALRMAEQGSILAAGWEAVQGAHQRHRSREMYNAVTARRKAAGKGPDGPKNRQKTHRWWHDPADSQYGPEVPDDWEDFAGPEEEPAMPAPRPGSKPPVTDRPGQPEPSDIDEFMGPDHDTAVPDEVVYAEEHGGKVAPPVKPYYRAWRTERPAGTGPAPRTPSGGETPTGADGTSVQPEPEAAPVASSTGSQPVAPAGWGGPVSDAPAPAHMTVPPDSGPLPQAQPARPQTAQEYLAEARAKAQQLPDVSAVGSVAGRPTERRGSTWYYQGSNTVVPPARMRGADTQAPCPVPTASTAAPAASAVSARQRRSVPGAVPSAALERESATARVFGPVSSV